jgi:hypothetical protein
LIEGGLSLIGGGGPQSWLVVVDWALKIIEAVARQAPGIVEVWGRGGGTRESDVARLIAAALTTQQ